MYYRQQDESAVAALLNENCLRESRGDSLRKHAIECERSRLGSTDLAACQHCFGTLYLGQCRSLEERSRRSTVTSCEKRRGQVEVKLTLRPQIKAGDAVDLKIFERQAQELGFPSMFDKCIEGYLSYRLYGSIIPEALQAD